MKTTKLFKGLANYGKYEISEDGKVRNIQTKKYKSIYQDKKGRSLVCLVEEDGTGVTTCNYIRDLLAETFDEETALAYVDAKQEEPMPEAKVIYVEKEVPAKTSKRKVLKIRCEETGQFYNGYSAVAKAFGWKYDKIYDKFYNSKKNTIIHEGHTFTKYEGESIPRSESEDASETE